jgi:GMP synthase (glutamine-hydrolysing)
MASTESCPIAGMADEERGFYAFQFHPEVTHTIQGTAIIERFVHQICHCKPDWVMGDYISEAVEHIRKQVGDEEVILGLSGGVDSSVAAALIHRAIGDQLTCVFVDHGLLRLNEGDMVMEMFARNLGVKVIRVDAKDTFMTKLAGVADPEAKRKIIGKEFVEIFQSESGKIKNAKWLAQGTIYPDVIESAGKGKKGAHTIKSHHNVGGLPEDMHLKLLEPLRELFKDEVRELGVALGLCSGPKYCLSFQKYTPCNFTSIIFFRYIHAPIPMYYKSLIRLIPSFIFPSIHLIQQSGPNT